MTWDETGHTSLTPLETNSPPFVCLEDDHKTQSVYSFPMFPFPQREPRLVNFWSLSQHPLDTAVVLMPVAGWEWGNKSLTEPHSREGFVTAGLNGKIL